MTEEAIPEWALHRVCELTNADGSTYTVEKFTKEETRGYSIGKAFARYIASHEEAPVDPREATKRALRDAYGAAAPEFVSAFEAALAFEGFAVTKIVETGHGE